MIITHKQFPDFKRYEMDYCGRPFFMEVGKMAELCNASVLAGYGGISLHEQSHGEGFFSLVMNRFRGRGLYILDEPEAALSPSLLAETFW